MATKTEQGQSSLWGKIKAMSGGNAAKESEILDNPEVMASLYRQAAGDITNKSVEQLQQEGKSAAGQAAAQKASEAKKAAKAATMQTGGNKLQAATNAASAASQAATEGFDTSSQAYTQMAGNIDAAETAAAKDSFNKQAEALQAKHNTEEAQRQSKKQFGLQSLTSGLGAAGNIAAAFVSDETKKKVKHTYIKPEDRVGRNK